MAIVFKDFEVFTLMFAGGLSVQYRVSRGMYGMNWLTRLVC